MLRSAKSRLSALGMIVSCVFSTSIIGFVAPALGADGPPEVVQTGTAWTTDFDGDGDTDIVDFTAFVSRYTCGPASTTCYTGAYLTGDYDCDGHVFITDFTIFAQAYAKSAITIGGYFLAGKC